MTHNSRASLRCRTMVVVLFPFFAIPTVMHAQETTLSPDIDGGGALFSFTCGTDKVMVGVSGGAGMWVNRVSGICRQVNRAGEWIGGDSSTNATATGGGSDFKLKCERNSAVAALGGRSGQWLDRLQVYCRTLGVNGQLTGALVLAKDGVNTTAGGGPGINAFGPIGYECASNRPARILRGRHGSVAGTPSIDRIGLDCQVPTVLKLNNIGVLYATTLGNTSSVTVQFNRAAAADQIVAVSSNSTGVITVPASTTVTQGNFQRSFRLSTVATGCALLTASYAGASRVGHAVVQPERVANYALWMSTPNELLIAPQQQTVTLSAAAPPGTVIRLASSNREVATVPATVTKVGLESMTFPVTGRKRGCTQIVATYLSFTVRRIVKVEEIGG
jgi:hypothetical protein